MPKYLVRWNGSMVVEAADRQAAYEVAVKLGDTCINIHVSGETDDSGNPLDTTDVVYVEDSEPRH